MAKLTELLEAISESRQLSYLLCLTETHEKFGKVNIPELYCHFAKRRKEGDKKGGGLMSLFENNVKVEMIETRSDDILCFSVWISNVKIFIILVYMDVKDQGRNDKIKREVLDILEDMGMDDNVMVLGDFNGHLGIIGEQQLDKNGKYVFDLMEKYNLVLMNGDDRCQGVTTREECGNKSSIDFVLCNSNLYKYFNCMRIDEVKKIYDLSDHCLIEVVFDISQQNSSTVIDSQTFEFYSLAEQNRESYVSKVKDYLEQLEEVPTIKEYDTVSKQAADDVLKRTYVKKTRKNKKQDPVWFTKKNEK